MKRINLRSLDAVLSRILLLYLFLPLLALSLLTVGVAGYLGRRDIESGQQMLARSLANTVGDYLDNAGRVLGTLALVADTSDKTDITNHMTAIWQSYGYFDTLYMIDENSFVTTLVPPDPRYEGLDMSYHPFFRQYVNDTPDGILISQPFTSIRTGQPTVYMALGLEDGGMVAGELSLGKLQETIIAEVRGADTDLVFITDRSGTLLAHIKSDLVAQQANVGEMGIVRRGLGEETTLLYFSDGGFVLGSSALVEETGWIVVTQVPVLVAYSPYLKAAGLALLLSPVVWLVLVWTLRRQYINQFVVPLGQLRSRADAMAAGSFEGEEEMEAIPAPFAELGALVSDFRRMSQAIRFREDALRASEKKYRELVQNANSIIVRLDGEGRVTFFNEFAQSFFGYTEEEMLGKHVVGTFVPEEDSSGRDLTMMVDDIIRNPERYATNENENILRDGKRVWVSWTNKAIMDDEGNVTEILCIGNDVTQRRELERRLQQSQKMEAVGTLTGGIAHEFNNLLTSIIGNISLVMMSVEPGSQVERDLAAAMKSSQRAAELVRQLLIFGRRAHVGGMSLLNLNITVEEVIKLLRQTIDRRIEIEAHLAENLEPIFTGHGQVNQVLMNLCLNSRDALIDRLEDKCGTRVPPEQGYSPTITITTENVTIGEEYCRTHPEAYPGRFVCLRVSDNGCGMDVDTQTQVFVPFFTTKEVGKGTGLGLPMVIGIVKEHNGFIDLYSEPDIITTFSVYFPCTNKLKAGEEESETETSLPVGSETILLVDDEAYIRELGRRVLERQGYTVLLAKDGQEALGVYERNGDAIDLILLDLTMPKLSGREVMNEILQIAPDVKIILTSGHSANDGPGHAAMNKGAVAFVQKPFDAHSLAQAVRNALDG